MLTHPIFLVGGCLGAVAMYYFDPRNGAYRRSLLRDQIRGTRNDLAHDAQVQGKRALHRAKGVLATGRLDRKTPRQPGSDEQLYKRVRARMGHLVSHPRLVEVTVDEGCVSLTGHVLRREVDDLVHELRRSPDIQKVHNHLEVHDSEEELQRIAGARGSAQAGGSAEPRPMAWPAGGQP